MDNELIFEHLINDKVSICLKWADLYRSASCVSDIHNEYKVGETSMCLLIALHKLKDEYSDNKREIIEDSYNKLISKCCSFNTIDEIITRLHEEGILF